MTGGDFEIRNIRFKHIGVRISGKYHVHSLAVREGRSEEERRMLRHRNNHIIILSFSSAAVVVRKNHRS